MNDQCAPAASPEQGEENLFGISELADRWGVSKQRADEIATARLGAPRYKLKMGRIWSLEQVSAFEKGWVRKSGHHVNNPPW